MRSERSRLLVGTSWTLTSTVFGLLTGAILRPLIVLNTGIDGYGVWSAAVAMASLFALGGDLGVSAALTKMVAEKEGAGGAIGTLASSALALAIGMGGICAAILGVSSGYIQQFRTFPNLATLLQLQALQIPLNLGTASLLGLFQGRRNFRGLALLTMAQGGGSLGFSALLLASGQGIVGVMVASLLVAAVIFSFLLWVKRRDLHFEGFSALRTDLRRLVPFGVRIAVTNALTTVLYQADIVVLSVWTSNASLIGTYALAIFVTRIVWILPGSIGMTTFPVISEYVAAKNGRRVSGYLTTALVASIAITGALSIAFILFGQPLLKTVFGRDATAAFPLALVLLPGTAFLGSLRAIAPSLPGAGRPDVGLKISGAGAAMLLLLAFVFTSLGGAVGTAAAVSLCFAILAVILLWATRRYVVSAVPDAPRLNTRRLLLCGLVALLGGAIALALALPDSPTFIGVVVAAAFWAVVSGVALVVSGGRETWGTLLGRWGPSALRRG